MGSGFFFKIFGCSEKWAYISRKIPKNWEPFLSIWPLNMVKGFEARAAGSRPKQIWVTPPPPPHPRCKVHTQSTFEYAQMLLLLSLLLVFCLFCFIFYYCRSITYKPPVNCHLCEIRPDHFTSIWPLLPSPTSKVNPAMNAVRKSHTTAIPSSEFGK